MKTFENYLVLTNINDSMELASGQIVAEISEGRYSVRVEVCGAVSVTYKGVTYRSVETFPDELLEKFHNKTAWNDDEVEVSESNWFEAFSSKDGVDDGCTTILDIQGKTPDEIRSELERLLDITLQALKINEAKDMLRDIDNVLTETEYMPVGSTRVFEGYGIDKNMSLALTKERYESYTCVTKVDGKIVDSKTKIPSGLLYHEVNRIWFANQLAV